MYYRIKCEILNDETFSREFETQSEAEMEMETMQIVANRNGFKAKFSVVSFHGKRIEYPTIVRFFSNDELEYRGRLILDITKYILSLEGLEYLNTPSLERLHKYVKERKEG